jgi:hypothetical protein
LRCSSVASAGLVDRPRLLGGAGEAVEVVQQRGAVGVQLVVELAAAAELAEEQAQPPPPQETLVVFDQVLTAVVG